MFNLYIISQNPRFIKAINAHSFTWAFFIIFTQLLYYFCLHAKCFKHTKFLFHITIFPYVSSLGNDFNIYKYQRKIK